MNRWLDKIHVGECAALMREMPAESVDLAVTSPPYDNLRTYNGYEFNANSVIEGLWHVVKKGGVVVWVVNDCMDDTGKTLTSFRHALMFKEAGFRMHDVMIYAKRGIRYPRPNAYHGNFEYMFIASKGAPSTFNPLLRRTVMGGSKGVSRKIRRNKTGERQTEGAPTFDRATEGKRYAIWDYDTGKQLKQAAFADAHPAMMPSALAQDHILSWSNPKDVVLDPMVGSGTTTTVARQLGRQWIGIDVSKEYAEFALKRTLAAPVSMLQEVL